MQFIQMQKQNWLSYLCAGLHLYAVKYTKYIEMF